MLSLEVKHLLGMVLASNGTKFELTFDATIVGLIGRCGSEIQREVESEWRDEDGTRLCNDRGKK